MQFELTDALVDQILFAMEDQNGVFALDSRSGTVIDLEPQDESEFADTGTEDLYQLPEWAPADGFRLMEGFAASLRNPIVRAELTAALDRGRGVFRAFKDVLAGHPEVEKLWFAYKEKKMRQEIIDWYNALREDWGLERIGQEPEETEDLVLEDFRFRPALDADAEALASLHSACSADESVLSPDFFVKGRSALVAESSRGEIAAFALAYVGGGEREPAVMLDVLPEFRGLGIGEKLLGLLVDALGKAGESSVSLSLPAAAESFSRVLYRSGFQPYETRYRLDLVRLRKEQF